MFQGMKIKLNNCGYSLIEVVIVIGILGFVMAGMTSVMSHSTRAMGKINALADATTQLTLLKTALADPDTCRLNFGGSKPPFQDAIIKNKLNKTTLGSPVVRHEPTPPPFLNSNESVLVGNAITPTIPAGTGNQVLRFKGNFITQTDGAVQSKSTLDFPIFATINPATGKIVECSTKSFFYGSKDLNEKVCSLASTSKEELVYDPETGSCAPVNEVRCTAGSATSASCDADAVGLVTPTLESCMVQNYSGENITYTRTFNGITKTLPMKPYICDVNASAKSVQCLLADDLDTSKGTVCLACCLYKRKKLVNN